MPAYVDYGKMSRELLDFAQDDILELIELYKCNPCLWDSQNIHNKNLVWKEQVRDNIAKQLNMTADEVRNKIKTLRCKWMKEYKRANMNEDYDSHWPYFHELMFLEGQLQTNSADTTTLSESSSGVARQRSAKRKISYASSWQDENEVQYNDKEEEIPIKKIPIKIERISNGSQYNNIEKCVIKNCDNDKRKLDMKYILSELEELNDNDYYDIHYDILSAIINIKKKIKISQPGNMSRR